MPPDDGTRIQHMLDACLAVGRLLEGQQRDALYADEKLRLALTRAIEIIGEAASKVSPETRLTHPELPWPAIIGMRNRLVHAYFDIDLDILWVAASREVPALLAQLQSFQETTE